MVFPVKKYKLVGDSMEPTLKDGDAVLVSNLLFKFLSLKKGDIVVAKHPVKGIPIIKRITNIKNDRYFLQGDNASGSSDSRDFGWLTKSRLLGRVFYSLL